MILVQCVGGPLDGERMEPRHPVINLQPAWTGRFFGRHTYRLIDEQYVYDGISAIDYANESAGNGAQEFKLPDNRRRR